jgi:endonuclease
VRLVVARCEVAYSGRLTTRLPKSVRLLMIKEDGTVMVWSDSGGSSVKPLNWMTPPTVVEEEDDRIVVRKRAGRSEDRLEIRLVEVLSDVEHEMGEAAALEKDGVERDLQEALAERPEWVEEGLRLVRREWPTDLRSCSSHRPSRSPTRAACAAWRSTWRCCAASASRS